MYAALIDCSCGCTKDSVSPAPPLLGEKRDPPPLQTEPPQVIAQGEEKTVHPLSPALKQKSERQVLYKNGPLPSGLSVEEHDDGPELETAVF